MVFSDSFQDYCRLLVDFRPKINRTHIFNTALFFSFLAHCRVSRNELLVYILLYSSSIIVVKCRVGLGWIGVGYRSMQCVLVTTSD